MNAVMEFLLQFLLLVFVVVAGAVVCAGLILASWNVRAILTTRWRCHRSWLPGSWARAHRRDPAWRMVWTAGGRDIGLVRHALDFPPIAPAGTPRRIRRGRSERR